MTPADFQHPVVESLPVLQTTQGNLIGFRMWDLENMETEFSVAFLTDDFRTAKRVFTSNTEVMDWWSDGQSIFILHRDSLSHVDLTFSEVGPKVDLPFAAYAIDAIDPSRLFVVGNGIAQIVGGSILERFELNLDATFRDITVTDESVHIVGEHGIALSIEGAEIHQWPLETDSILNDILADDLGLAIAGKSASFRGAGQRLEKLVVPDDVENMLSVASFQGARYWGADGWGDGYGFFKETAAGFKRLSDELPQHMTSDETFLYLSCAAEVYRFNGEMYEGLGLRFVEEEWVLRSIR